MLPKSSIELRRRTITCDAAIRCAPRASVMLTIAGSSSGVRPTASASAKRNESTTGRCRYTLMAKIAITSSRVIWISSPPKRRSPRSNSVSGGRSRSCSAMLAEHGVGAGLHDHGTAGAAHHVRALEQRVRPLRERRVVGEVARAPSRPGSSLRSAWTRRRRGPWTGGCGSRQGPPRPPRARSRRPARARSCGSSISRPSRRTLTLVWMTASSLATALLARYSCKKPSRALPSTIARTINASVVSPRKSESVIANSRRMTSGLRNWFEQESERSDLAGVGAAVGPEAQSCRSASAAPSPSAVAPSSAQSSCTGRAQNGVDIAR